MLLPNKNYCDVFFFWVCGLCVVKFKFVIHVYIVSPDRTVSVFFFQGKKHLSWWQRILIPFRSFLVTLKSLVKVCSLSQCLFFKLCLSQLVFLVNHVKSQYRENVWIYNILQMNWKFWANWTGCGSLIMIICSFRSVLLCCNNHKLRGIQNKGNEWWCGIQTFFVTCMSGLSHIISVHAYMDLHSTVSLEVYCIQFCRFITRLEHMYNEFWQQSLDWFSFDHLSLG